MNIYEKKVNVSVCKSNIKRNGAYFARVCKNGKVGSRELLQELKRLSPYIDIGMMSAGLETLASIIFDFVRSGFDVDFFNLGTFSLATNGKLEIKEGMKECASCNDVGYDSEAHFQFEHSSLATAFDKAPTNREAPAVCSSCGDYDISDAIASEVQFSLKFSPSKLAKKGLQHVKMNLAIKKKRSPVVEKIEMLHPQSALLSPAFIKIEGYGLKVEGDDEKVGIYIEEKVSSSAQGAQSNILANALESCNVADASPSIDKAGNPAGTSPSSDYRSTPSNSNASPSSSSINASPSLMKIPASCILRNEPKNLLLMLESEMLKEGAEYNICIITQYREGGVANILRVGGNSFVYSRECETMQNSKMQETRLKTSQKAKPLSTQLQEAA